MARLRNFAKSNEGSPVLYYQKYVISVLGANCYYHLGESMIFDPRSGGMDECRLSSELTSDTDHRSMVIHFCGARAQCSVSLAFQPFGFRARNSNPIVRAGAGPSE